jgi:hypothetical protein
VTALQHGDVGVGLVGQDRLESVSVVIGERQLCPRTLATDNQSRHIGPGGEVEAVGDLDDLPVLAFRAVPVQRRDPVLIRGLKDRGADGLGQLVAEGKPQIPTMAVIGGLVRRAGRVGPDLGSRCSRSAQRGSAQASGRSPSCGPRRYLDPAFPGRSSIASASRVSSAHAPSGWNPYPCL